jgi:hypothetical protein
MTKRVSSKHIFQVGTCSDLAPFLSRMVAEASSGRVPPPALDVCFVKVYELERPSRAFLLYGVPLPITGPKVTRAVPQQPTKEVFCGALELVFEMRTA